jgi:hypothetical protein
MKPVGRLSMCADASDIIEAFVRHYRPASSAVFHQANRTEACRPAGPQNPLFCLPKTAE